MDGMTIHSFIHSFIHSLNSSFIQLLIDYFDLAFSSSFPILTSRDIRKFLRAWVVFRLHKSRAEYRNCKGGPLNVNVGNTGNNKVN